MRQYQRQVRCPVCKKHFGTYTNDNGTIYFQFPNISDRYDFDDDLYKYNYVTNHNHTIEALYDTEKNRYIFSCNGHVEEIHLEKDGTIWYRATDPFTHRFTRKYKTVKGFLKHRQMCEMVKTVRPTIGIKP